LHQPWMIDGDDCGTVGGTNEWQGNWSTRRKPAPVPLCPLQIPHDLTWDWTWAATVRIQQQTAWVTAQACLVKRIGWKCCGFSPSNCMHTQTALAFLAEQIQNIIANHSAGHESSLYIHDICSCTSGI
jgi:hypothetical protein